MGDEKKRQVACPRCRTKVSWDENPHRPFCSEKCRLVDLGKWAEGEYFILGEKVPQPDSEDNN
ncbi:hypothetical protein SAMN05660860_01963 [Geoalkalibacter ferrihydriticus]|uniref:Uncharacterized protein n=1 Tax=Geoalkalibacter ferrihydriticus TaxID=392333 RepID=A0A1G9QZE1_9BACT|nr:DNA gyrase inhibitor YacG [Geoalkalibacter ferrihydriticus]SDM16344.1 hypothetical protein SAMN05660860_01963 [Geoalkalibacter ferrihydriticus]